MDFEHLLEGKQIRFSYGDETIFDSFSFSVQPGERIVLKGESGSGKTTLFRLILGFENPEKGEIRFKNHNTGPESYQTLRKESAWLPQDLNIGTGSLNDVIHFPFTFKTNQTQLPTGAEIESMHRNLGLASELLKKPYSDLSTGQRQRAGIALCMLLNKPILMLDEPTSALDEASKQKAVDLLFQDKNRTIISTSHDPFWIDHCSRVINLDSKTDHGNY